MQSLDEKRMEQRLTDEVAEASEAERELMDLEASISNLEHQTAPRLHFQVDV